MESSSVFSCGKQLSTTILVINLHIVGFFERLSLLTGWRGTWAANWSHLVKIQHNVACVCKISRFVCDGANRNGAVCGSYLKTCDQHDRRLRYASCCGCVGKMSRRVLSCFLRTLGVVLMFDLLPFLLHAAVHIVLLEYGKGLNWLNYFKFC